MFALLVSVLALLWFFPHPSAHAAPQYIQAPSLTDSIRTPVSACEERGQVSVPLITWGGDIATLHGNGNARQTAPDSLFAQQGLQLKLVREDVFAQQVEQFLSCTSPYLRGTLGMINMAAEVTSRDARTAPVVIYQMTWSVGGDAMVVKANIHTPKDLKGKTIAVQAYGPHVDYLAKILTDAGLTIQDVRIKWVKDLTGTDNTPMVALQEDTTVDAALVIIPDALALTSGGGVGTGSEDSVKGARILLSTKTANRIIADVYAVRADYLATHRDDVQKFVHGLMRAEEHLKTLVTEKQARAAEYQQMISAAADILLDSPQAVSDAEGLYADCEYVGFPGNVKFFGDAQYPRNLDRLTQEIQTAFQTIGLLSQPVPLVQAKWDYARLKSGLRNVAGVEVPRFDTQEVARVVTRRQQQGRLAEGELFSFEVFFQPNQNAFSADLYRDAFAQVVNLASTYGGAVITIEGHSDPLGYLKQKKTEASEVVLKRVKQSAKNLSLTRASAVRDSLIAYARGHGVALDHSQFSTVGHGVMQPKTGLCGPDPCAPQTEQEWRDNMRVEFRIIQVEAEASVFKPL